MSETELILQEVRDHAAYWKSDICKRLTVEKHLTEKGIRDVHQKIEDLVRAGRLTVVPRHAGDYLKETGT